MKKTYAVYIDEYYIVNVEAESEGEAMEKGAELHDDGKSTWKDDNISAEEV